MQELFEAGIRFVGWLVLKALTLGRYRSDARSGLVVEGALGLLSIAALLWVAYIWWPA